MAIQGMYQQGTVEQKIELLSMVQMSILDYLMDGDRKQGNNPADLLRSLIAGDYAQILPSLHSTMHQTISKHLLWK